MSELSPEIIFTLKPEVLNLASTSAVSFFKGFTKTINPRKVKSDSTSFLNAAATLS